MTLHTARSCPGVREAVLGALLVVGLAASRLPAGDAKTSVYPSPHDAAFSPCGKTVAVCDRVRGSLVLVDVAEAKVKRTIPLDGEPAAVVWTPGETADACGLVHVAEYGARTVAEVHPARGQVVRRLSVGLRPQAVAVVPGRKVLLAANVHVSTLSVVDLQSGKETKQIPLVREPFDIAVTADESLAVVSNLLPFGRSSSPDHASVVSLVELDGLEKVKDIRLPPGSASVRGVAISPDGNWAYAVHTLGRTNLPTTQLERGWVNTNGLTVIDLRARSYVATVLLDHPMEGVADPWSLAVSPDGKHLWVTISGTHQLVTIDRIGLHDMIAKCDEKQRADLANDLASLYRSSLARRTRIPGRGPRGMSVSPDGSLLAVAVYFSGHLALIDPATGKAKATVAIGEVPEPDIVRRGEMIFHDADYCFQRWLTCATCHPNEARADGLNWDLLNDGLGNPKNNRSLLFSHRTPPTMSLGVRATMESASEAGFIHILFRQPDEEMLTTVPAYLRSLEALPSPHLREDGTLTAAASRGKAIFESDATACLRCHPGPLYTDLKLHDVGTVGELDRASRFDTPTLIELYRTGPYLHDGSAATLREVLVDRNREDKHGHTSQLSRQQIDDLIAYLLSL